MLGRPLTLLLILRVLRGRAGLAPLPSLSHAVDLTLQIPDLLTLIADNIADVGKPKTWWNEIEYVYAEK